jgi:hypothetical protein
MLTTLFASYRNTATLVSLILEGGFMCPHRTIDEYVDAYTNFKPTDGEVWVCKEPLPFFNIPEKVDRLDFDKMREPRVFFAGCPCSIFSLPIDARPSSVAFILYEGILYGRYLLDSYLVDTVSQNAELVRIGFARHKPGNETVVDEPLAILAALQWINKSPQELIQISRKNMNDTNGFEAYLFFHLRQIFEMPMELDTVFTFRSDFTSENCPWQHEKFELVTVCTDEDGTQRVSVVTPSSGPSSNIGFKVSSGEDVLEWISTNRRQVTFCFPPSSMGPDILFFGRSEASGKLVLLVITCQAYNVIKKEHLINGVRNVTPSWFWKDKRHKVSLFPWIVLPLE